VVESSSQAVDVSSGTTRMQLAVANDNGELMPGSYGNVSLDLARDVQPLHIPASALIFDQNGLRVATVGLDDKVVFKKVTIARDLGREIELASGLSAEDRVILTPLDGLAENDQVRTTDGTQRKVPTAASAQEAKAEPR
jgi:multidrug efflux pump subunit AcrA (membrane-fusion protein)